MRLPHVLAQNRPFLASLTRAHLPYRAPARQRSSSGASPGAFPFGRTPHAARLPVTSSFGPTHALRALCQVPSPLGVLPALRACRPPSLSGIPALCALLRAPRPARSLRPFRAPLRYAPPPVLPNRASPRATRLPFGSSLCYARPRPLPLRTSPRATAAVAAAARLAACLIEHCALGLFAPYIELGHTACAP